MTFDERQPAHAFYEPWLLLKPIDAPDARVSVELRQSYMPTVALHEGVAFIYQITAEGDMNFAHCLLDDAFAAYETLRMFDKLQPNQTRLFAARGCEDFSGWVRGLCEKFLPVMYRPVTAFPIQSLQQYPQDEICFRELVIGSGLSGALHHGGFDNHNRAAEFFSFRNAVLRASGIENAPKKLDPRIIIVKKKGRRAIRNPDEVAGWIRSEPRYRSLAVEVIDDWEGMELSDQFRLFQRATICLSPCGGISFIAFFLPRDTHLIVSGFPWEIAPGMYKSSRMEGHFWDQQTHIRTLYYTATDESDYVVPFPKPWSFAQLRNYAEVIIRQETLFPLLDRALLERAINNANVKNGILGL